jgi:MFS family permease
MASKSATATASPAKVSDQATPQAYYALGVLLAAYILSFIDRNVMAVLIGPIRQDLDISDFQYSLLHGFAFSMFYIVLGIPIARLADHSNRKWILTIGIFFWSIMCVLCGMARTVTMLFIARIGVAVGAHVADYRRTGVPARHSGAAEPEPDSRHRAGQPGDVPAEWILRAGRHGATSDYGLPRDRGAATC